MSRFTFAEFKTTTPVCRSAYFHIQPLQHLAESDDAAIPQSNCYTILYYTKGAGTCTIDLNRYFIQPATLYYTRPGQVLLPDHTSDAEGFMLTFSRCFFSEPYEQERLFPASVTASGMAIHLPAGDSAELCKLLERMQSEFMQQAAGREEILRSLLKIMLQQLHRQADKVLQPSVQHGNAYIVRKFMNLLEKNYTQWKMVADYARELSITANYLNEIIKKVTGSSARHHIQQRVITEAKRQAIYAGMSMKEVAYHVGFDDIYHFSKYFKNVSGVNFTEFKRRYAAALVL